MHAFLNAQINRHHTCENGVLVASVCSANRTISRTNAIESAEPYPFATPSMWKYKLSPNWHLYQIPQRLQQSVVRLL